MNLQPYAAAVVAASGIAGLYLQARRTTLHAAEEIKRELDILDLLPENSKMRKPLQERIEGSLERYIAKQKEHTRDWSGVAVAVILDLSAAFFAAMALNNGGWWWLSLVVALPFGVFGIVGFLESIANTKRDANGIRLSE
ncbi:hypothetical protein [Streptomyces chartreusis]|uniref:hypothetical protein n=1 Tax=Streptomyces chartreusis TaxID=1969 RepID=UPI003657A7D5